MKRVTALLLSILALAALAGCGEARTVHCDHCGGEILLEAGSNMDEDWIVFCKTCEEELFGDDPVVEPG